MFTKKYRFALGVVACVVGALLLLYSFIRIADAAIVSCAVFPLGCLSLVVGAFCFVPELLGIYDPTLFPKDATMR